MKSLADILASGKFDPAVEGVLRRSEAVTENSDAYRASLEKRAAARNAILTYMTSRGISALAYPTLRRKAAVIGQAQAGNNCQLSAATDLPAISFPAGFTADGLPIGLELLGLPWGEPQLLKAAYVYEQVMRPRHAPASTP
jgi:amidase